jgi:hypothetical protein
MNKRIVLRAGVYMQTKLHRQHVSDAIKKWWSVPKNKQRMRSIQTGTTRGERSAEHRKNKSESMKRYYRDKHRKERDVRDNDKD